MIRFLTLASIFLCCLYAFASQPTNKIKPVSSPDLKRFVPPLKDQADTLRVLVDQGVKAQKTRLKRKLVTFEP